MIIYFSGTGNSEYVAKALLQEGERIIDVMKEKESVLSDERIGIVFPEYCSAMPPYLIEYLQNATIKANYIFCVGTCGANAKGGISGLQYILQSKGKRLSYGKKIVMPDSCVLLAFPPKTVKKLLTKQDEKIAKIKQEIEQRTVMEIRAKKPLTFKSKAVWWAFNNVVGIKRKKVIKDKCVNCSLCEKACKMNNIKVTEKGVIIGKNCAQCFACINVCQNNAIKFGLLKAKDEKRYMHPNREI